jgi:hypothetical protein
MTYLVMEISKSSGFKHTMKTIFIYKISGVMEISKSSGFKHIVKTIFIYKISGKVRWTWSLIK